MRRLIPAFVVAALLVAPSAFAQKKKTNVVELQEITITGRVQKPIAAVDISRIAPKLSLGELRQPFLDKIEQAVYADPFLAVIPALVVAWAVALFAVSTMTMRVRRVLAATSVDADVLARATKRDRSATERWPGILAATPLAELASALALEEGPARPAAVNEALSDLGASLAWGAELSGAALRLLIFGTILASLVPSLLGASSDDFLERTLALGAVGGGAAIGILAARRLIDAHVVEARRAIDAWVEASTPS